tara:strand:+ start:225 stop:446 length:222 start_codon:yes stop_codon:yes gene_type:complete
MSQKSLQLDDSAVGHVAKILQVALITGTDIIDHMRMIRFSEKDSKLFLEEEYQKTFDVSLDTMLQNAQDQQGE